MRILGFEVTHRDGTKEQVFKLDRGRSIQVYSTVVGMVARGVGEDSIKVCALYETREGQYRGIGRAKRRVHRTGTIEGIVERMLGRIKEVIELCETAELCHCGEPKGLSKAGKLYCLDLCWKRDRDGNLPPDNWQPTRYRRGYRRY